MVNCIGNFVLITLKRSRLNDLSATVLLFDKDGVNFPLATVRDFHFTLLNSILLPSMVSFRFRFLQNPRFAEMSPLILNLFLTSASVVELCYN